MDRQVRGEASSWSPDMLRKLIIRTMYGIVNASRNAV